METETGRVIGECLSRSADRYAFWVNFVNSAAVRKMVEVGIFRGDFAERMLRECSGIETYYMIDPWRSLDGWDKPANSNDETLELLMQRALEKTAFAAKHRVVLRGTTSEVIDRIPDGSLDLAYIDGDHTLRGITIDLMRVYPKVRTGGFVGGDDFCPGDLQHFPQYEPTLVFPYAVYFAEAVSARLYVLPHDQFLIEKTAGGAFELVDIAGTVKDSGLKGHIIRALQAAASGTPG